MHFAGTLDIAASQSRVWRFLTDPREVSTCGPDVQSLEVLDPRHFKVTVRAGVGPIRGTFAFDVVFTEIDEPRRATIRARGQAPGSAVEMLNSLELSPAATDRTTMRWTSDVTVNGTIASVGARLLQGTAEKMTQQVFGCIKEKLEAPAATAGAPAEGT
ncbi:MAG: hypothetical protein AUH85_12345 [Chloroflexi bacterium 13_1_40CM_4_68_4]|nr:MAG: hypothetical protein AUH85_12345 [Chloroflexi bacterium 13_1_40CM_4_68_4]